MADDTTEGALPAAGDLYERYAQAVAKWALMYPLGNWGIWGTADGDARDQLAKIADNIAAGWGRALADRIMAVRDREVEQLRAALTVALAALEGAETSCRYHGENPPKAPAWHGGCESCRQPTRVREALAAIRALTTEEADRG